MIRQFSRLYVKPGTIISFDSNPDFKYKVDMCIDLRLFEIEGYQLNLVRV